MVARMGSLAWSYGGHRAFDHFFADRLCRTSLRLTAIIDMPFLQFSDE